MLAGARLMLAVGIHTEIFEEEGAVAWIERRAAAEARYFGVACYGTFDSHNAVLSVALRATDCGGRGTYHAQPLCATNDITQDNYGGEERFQAWESNI